MKHSLADRYIYSDQSDIFFTNSKGVILFIINRFALGGIFVFIPAYKIVSLNIRSFYMMLL